MSYFRNGVIYVIVPTADITTEMINIMKLSFNSTPTSLRETGARDKTLFKIKNPTSSVFNSYIWFNSRDIKIELKKEEWN